MTFTNWLPAVLVLAIPILTLRVYYMFRARAMRSLAAATALQYIGPPAPKWWNPSHAKFSPPLPTWLSKAYGRRMRQIWNVIEGEQNGTAILIFDAVIGEYKGGAPCTSIACQTEQSPFEKITRTDRLIQSHGWTVLHGAWFLGFSWMMRVSRVEQHLKKLRVR